MTGSTVADVRPSRTSWWQGPGLGRGPEAGAGPGQGGGPMNILGLSGGIKIGNQDGAAAFVVDGELVAAAEEERFLGIKFANGQLPRQAITFCLKQAGLDVRDLDAVVFAGATYERFEEILEGYFDFQFGHAPRSSWLITTPPTRPVPSTDRAGTRGWP
ncbi:MAG: hypothetical protein Ct9H300mP1_22010 [Planctomycetaceae bacterium]|nr:MAG: hypothetical protein Ct9H300mP1_22010 [Planctomycetaceae bacterium]